MIDRTWGIEIVQEIINRIFQIYKMPEDSKLISDIDSLGEVKNMLETKAKEWEKEVLEKGIEKGINKGINRGIEQVALNMIKHGESDKKITLYTGLSIEQITEIRKKSNEKTGK